MSTPTLGSAKPQQPTKIEELPADHICHVTAGYGAFGVAKEYQMLLMLKTHMEEHPDEPAPCKIKLYSFNEGDDDNRGPAYYLKTSYLALNFPASAADPVSVKNAGETKTMDLIRDMEAKDFYEWVLAEKEKSALDEDAVKEARTIHEQLSRDGLTELQIAERMPYEQHKLFHLNCTKENDGQEWEWNSYYPRALYGEYLEDRKARSRALIDEINEHYDDEIIDCVETRNDRIASVASVEKIGGEFCFTLNVENAEKGSYQLCTNILTVATGHQYNELFLSDAKRAELRETECFTDSPYHDNELLEMLDKTNGEMHIGGAGASMLDAIRAAEVWEGHNPDKKAKITIVTPKPEIKVWGLDHTKNIHAGKMQGERLCAGFMYDLEQLGGDDNILEKAQELLSEYVHSESAIDCGPQNLFLALEGEGKKISEILGDDIDKFEKFMGRYSSTTTSPASYQSYRRFLDNGQMDFVAGYIDGTNIENKGDHFVVPYEDSVTGEEKTLEAKGFADCFSLANAPFYHLRNPENEPQHILNKTIEVEIDGETVSIYVPDPLTRDLLTQGILVPDLEERAVTAHPDYEGHVYVTGAGASRARGIPFSTELINAQASTLFQITECYQSRHDGPAPTNDNAFAFTPKVA